MKKDQIIPVSVEIGTDGRYCHLCRWMEQCPPGCRLFNMRIKHCLGGGPLRCGECMEAEKSAKEKNG